MALIPISTLVFVTIGKPLTDLVIAGSLSGLILPTILGAILLASRNKGIVGDCYHPTRLISSQVFLALLVTAYAGVICLSGIVAL